ncbi:bifunctional -methylene-tetrahydrofolate dehydrogenase -methylene-tetrahydrofolate cyclohydrolase [Lasius niger]|uniref:Bifunctional-methylene-tetrahydrofolate dehydrogenase-methylene-tetrahydrofolate cyclohydrolase n=1 Tax=Lasius niger TaxID=67767 RepID=A0A0J7NST0_LASNI|nr:bifunctional -methylene-tetrahydrofolate dehydrogenase -methylene-tetrahydrofolate cyclohydrolase [Lasius niger]
MKKEGTPNFGFTPDGLFPLTYAEKAIIDLDIIGIADKTIKVAGGDAYNVTCSTCTIENVDLEKFYQIGLKKNYRIEKKKNKIIIHGKPAHGSKPNEVNFVTDILKEDTNLKTYFGQYDDESGSFTINVGIVTINEKESKLGCNIRIPVHTNKEIILEQLEKLLAPYNLTISIKHYDKPLYMPLNSPIVTELMKIYQKVTNDKQSKPIAIGGVVIIVGDDYASHLYVKNKVKACKECGIKTEVIYFAESVVESEIITTIKTLNQNSEVDGILVQLPLTKNLNEFKILNSISEKKDVDGLTNINAGKLLQNDSSAIIPCTVKGIIALLKAYNITIVGQDVTIINNSNIIGKPLAMLLNNLGATVSLTHKETKDLKLYLQNANIIISATGVHNLFSAQEIKNDVVIIDVAINKSKNKKLVGDVDFETIKDKVKAISPVPGGVGPMTIAMLLDNLITLYHQK